MESRAKSETISPPLSGTAMASEIRQVLPQVDIFADLVLFMFGFLSSCLASFYHIIAIIYIWSGFVNIKSLGEL
jgi:hypothetical protein